MSFEWQLVRLGDLISLKGGFSYKGECLGSSGPVLLGMGVVSHSERFLKDGIRRYSGELPSAHRVTAGDMVIATRQQSDNSPILGCAALVPKDLPSEDIVVGTNLYKVTNTSDVENRFLYWLLRGKEYQRRIIKCSKGTTVRMITKDAIEDFYFLCPPLQTRNKITEFLDALDERITLLRETNSTLEIIAQTLFKSWFVDFDPVRAKSEGKFPEGMDETTARLFPDTFEDGELGLMPKGWIVKSMSEVLKPKNQRVGDLNVPEYSSTNNGLVPRDKLYLKQLANSSSKNKLITRGDIVFGLSRQILNFGQMNDAIGSVSSAYKVYQVDSSSMLPALMGRLIRTRSHYFFNAVSASSREGQSISSEALGFLKFIEPPLDVQRFLWQQIEMLTESAAHNLLLAEQLQSIRDTLLPRLISGQLRIADAEEELEKVIA